MSVLNILEEKLAETKKQGRFREFLNLERGVQDKPWATSHGHHGERRLNVWCSNDYLAMSHHPKVLLATTDAVNRVGLGTCGARSISGTSVYHSELETLLASAYGKESALLFTTGFGANDATLSTLCDAIPDLIVFSDELNHASMIYGIRYSNAEKKIFRHNDVAHLAELLQAADPARPKLIAFESLYSMDGDFAPLAQIVALAEQYQALTYLDEIHSAGVYGERGLGYAVHPGQVDSSMLVLAKEWGIWRKAVSRLLEDFSERGLIRVDSNPVTSIIDMVCVKSWMIAGRLIENPAYRQTIKAYEGVRIFLFNGQQLETLRRSSARKKKKKTIEETAEGTDGLPSMNLTGSNPIIEGTGTAETETAATTESEVESTVENAVVDAGNTPVLEDGNTLSGSQKWKHPQE